MNDDVAARLRALAQESFEGRLSVAAYRRLRAPLLDSLINQAPGIEEFDAVTQPRNVGFRASVSSPSTGGSRRRLWRVAWIVGVALAAGALAWKLILATPG
jgi:hypothetical protein